MNKRNQKLLPDKYLIAHDLCFLNHDILVQLLASGEAQNIFTHRFKFKSEDEANTFRDTNDLFGWLESYGRIEDRVKIIRTAIFPALLSDLLHFVYESLDISKKAKLTVVYALLRKPLQENLCLFEQMLVDMNGVHDTLSIEPEKLYSQSAGGIEPHTKRIEQVINILEMNDLFDAKYIAQLRYDKNTDDGFDGICNKAMHLFTTHKSIKTETFNINFIFSDHESRSYQWEYLYSRLPYLLAYTRSIIERIGLSICQTNPLYLEELERRSSAGVLLWSKTVNPEYWTDALLRFIESTAIRLASNCMNNGYRLPTEDDLEQIYSTGAFPGESKFKQRKRHKLYAEICNRNIKCT